MLFVSLSIYCILRVRGVTVSQGGMFGRRGSARCGCWS
jgi:hypothetical protein